MSFSKIATVAGALALVTKVAAHGTVTGLVADGVYYQGYSANFQYMASPPVVVGWSTPEDQSNGPITPDAYATSDIICHLGATNAGASATVAAGGTVDLQWTVWPESHHGPVIDYLANCNGDCTTVDKTALEFFKIDGVGLIDDTTVPGNWASDQLIANNNTWSLTIPSDIAPGSYVLRHEIIALHSAGEANGAQNYPQCFNLEITGSGTAAPSGTLGTALYTATEAGILVNIYTALTSYLVPGPALYSGASSGSSSAKASSTKVSSAASSSVAAITKAAAVSSAKSSSAAGITAPAGAIASGSPFSNGTLSKTKKSKSACKVKTSGSVPVASGGAKINAVSSSIEEQATTVTIPTTSVSVAKPTSTKPASTKAASSGDFTSTSPNASTSSSASGSTSAPKGTTLSTLLSWVSSFYTKHADTEYTESTVARRQHARDVVPGNHEGGFAAASGFAAPSGSRQGHAHGTGAHSAGFPRPTGSFSKGSFFKGAAAPSGHHGHGTGFAGPRPTGSFSKGNAKPSGDALEVRKVKGTGVQSGSAQATGKHHGHHGHGTGVASAGFAKATGSFSKGNAKPSGDALEVRKVKGTGVQSGSAQATGKHHGHHGHGTGVASAGFAKTTGSFSKGSAKPTRAVEARQHKIKGTGVQSGSPKPTGHGGRPHGTGVAGGAKPTNSFAAGSAQPSGFGGRFRMSN